MNSFGYGILGGIAGGAEGLIEQRRQEAEEAKAMNLARFQQQLSRENYEFQNKLDEQRDIASEGRAAAREDELRAVVGSNKAGVAVFADKKGNLYSNGQPHSGAVYEKWLSREEKAPEFTKEFTDENGNRIAYDPKNPQAQIVLGKDGNYKPKGGLSEYDKIRAETRLAELETEGIHEGNYREANVLRGKLGLPQFKKTETKAAEDGWFGTGFRAQPAEYEYREDWEGFDKKAPEVLPKTGGVGVHGAIMQAESSGRQGAVSEKGATGLMQLMPATAAELGVNPKDKFQNVAGGVRYFDDMLAKYGDKNIALAAYNWGPGNVDKWLKRGGNEAELPAETRAYIKRVNALAGEEQPSPTAPAGQPEAKPTKPEIIPKQEKKWYDHPFLTGSLDAGELASKPLIAAADTARGIVSAGIGAVKGAAQFAEQLRKELTEQEYQALMREKGQRSDDEFFSLLRDFGIAGVKSWLNSGNVSKNAEKFYGKPGNDLNKYLR